MIMSKYWPTYYWPAGYWSTYTPWLLIPDYLRWKGVWLAAYGYDRDDAVVYKSGGLIHAFVSKTDHNTGNIPRSTYQHWTRLVQEQWEK